jgi:hypothetical protein
VTTEDGVCQPVITIDCIIGERKASFLTMLRIEFDRVA